MANTITEMIGLDMGDRYMRYSILDQQSGEEVGNGRIRTTLMYGAWLVCCTFTVRLATTAGMCGQ